MAAAAVATENKAGFWIRFVAYVVDVIVIVVVEVIIAAVLFGGDFASAQLVNILISLAYLLYFWSSYGGGQTIGMRLFNLKVVRTDGSELTLVNALVRYVGFIVAAIPILIGLIWVAFDKDKQGWHDKIAGTYVVRT